jgi:endoglucanase
MVTDAGSSPPSRPGPHRRRAGRGVGARARPSRYSRLSARRLAMLVVLSLVAAIPSTVLLVMGTASVAHLRPSTGNRLRPGNGGPFAGAQLFIDPSTPAAQAEASLERSDPAAAASLRKITSHPAGIWFGGWIPVTQVAAAIATVMREAEARHAMPLLVLYAFPYRGCAGDAAAASAEAAAYERWIGQVAVGIGAGKAAVILEPDALAQYIRLACLSRAEQQDRLVLIRRAVDQLVKLPNAYVYLDAGNSRWKSARAMAPLLLAAGIEEVRGFSVNVSNFNSTADEESYGDSLSALLHGKHYVIDTSRNGTATAATWCNPPGQALGAPPTTRFGNPLVDALLWVKPPWASDGTCNGGPPAGMFWLPYALSLARNAGW